MNAAPTTIDYDKLCEEYRAGLIETLRNFDGKLSFSELWVPDEDLHKSLLSLFTAAREGKQDSLRIALGAKTAEKLDRARMEQAVGILHAQIAFAPKDGQIILDVSGLSRMEQEETGILHDFSGIREAKRRSGLAASANHRAAAPLKDNPAEPTTIPLAYREALTLSSQTSAFGRKPQPASGSLLVAGTLGSANMFIVADKATSVVTDFGYTGVHGKIACSLLEQFGKIMIGIPMQEAADHGILRLEAALRKRDAVRSLPGIMHPRAIDPAFRWIELLVRFALRDWCKNSGQPLKPNEFDAGPSEKWKTLPLRERLHLIEKIIKDTATTTDIDVADISVEGIAHDVRIIVSLPSEWQSQKKSRILLILERAFKDHADPRLEIYGQELKDRNALRRLT